MNYYSIWPDFFSIWHIEKGHVQKECGLDTCWWFRNSANQLRLVVHPIFYRVLYSIILFTSQCRNHKKTEVNHTDATPKDQPTDQQRLSLVLFGKESQPPKITNKLCLASGISRVIFFTQSPRHVFVSGMLDDVCKKKRGAWLSESHLKCNQVILCNSTIPLSYVYHPRHP